MAYKPRRGRPAIPLLDRVAAKISIDGICGLDWDIAQYARVSPHRWPEGLHSDWIWVGATTSPGVRLLNGIPHQNRKEPRLKGITSVARETYKLMIGPIPDDRRLRYYRRGESNAMDVNPLHWRLIPRSPSKNAYPYKPSDFLVTPEESSDDELVEMLNEEYAKSPFTTWAEFHARFDELWFDVPREEQIAALTKAGLLDRLC